MIILAFDSTAKAASVAVSDGERLLADYTVDNGLTQSELLLPMAEHVLASLKMSFDDVDIFAAAVGPGSFTGVRIGVSLVKGLAFAKDKPCISVSTLEALAENITPLEGILVPVMDARRSQVYTALFECDGKSAHRLSEDVAIPISELAERLREHKGRTIYLAGDGYIAAKDGLAALDVVTADTPELLLRESAYSVARVAHRKHLSGDILTDREISPTYLRVPQAERERLEREAEKTK